MKSFRSVAALALALCLAALCLAALCLAASASAQGIDDESADVALTARITIVDVVAKTLALESANGERTVVGVDDQTTIRSGAKKIGFDALQNDDWVAVDADRRGATVVATFIEVVDDPTDDD